MFLRDRRRALSWMTREPLASNFNFGIGMLEQIELNYGVWHGCDR
jgi:hypothetical protein